MNQFPDRIHFSLSLFDSAHVAGEIWIAIIEFLRAQACLPLKFEISPSILGDCKAYGDTHRVSLSPFEIAELLSDRRESSFWVDTGHSSRSIGFNLLHSVLSCRIEKCAKAPDDWSKLLISLMNANPTVGAWQWRQRYQVWQWVRELREGHYERNFGVLPKGFKRSILKSDDGIGSDREFIDISLNPGRPKELRPTIHFYPTAEMWLGPHFWQYAKCTKEQALAAEFFIEKRDTPHYLYLKCWPEPFTRPDGEQGRMQQRLWKLFFHEDCEWPPGSGTICDEPMYGPPELMPGYRSLGAASSER